MINQEILFRGFHPCEDGDTTIYVEGEAVKGRWVEGLLLKSLDENGTHFEIQTWHEDSDGVTSRLLDILPSTVCPYTGLTDKNGKKIFKGDIAMCPYIDPIFKSYISNDGEKCLNNAPLPIIYEQGTFCIDYNREGKGLFSLNAFCSEKDIEVIGTIFDKPKE